jgi:hypothetical protein
MLLATVHKIPVVFCCDSCEQLRICARMTPRLQLASVILFQLPANALIPADGFYERRKVLGGKIPCNIQMKHGRPFVFAGLWEGWKQPGTQDWIRTCTIIRGEPNELVRKIHTRMQVILPEEQLDAWLSGEAGKEILNVSSSVQVLVPLLISAPSKVVAPVTAAE